MTGDPIDERFDRLAALATAEVIVREAWQMPGHPHYSAFLLGRAMAILEGLLESPTDAIDLLAEYRKWMEQES